MPQLQFEKFKSVLSRRRLMDRQRRSLLAPSALGVISKSKSRHTLSSAPAPRKFILRVFYQCPQPLCRRKFNAKLTTWAGLRVDKYHNAKDFLLAGLPPYRDGVGAMRNDWLGRGVNLIDLVINCYFTMR